MHDKNGRVIEVGDIVKGCNTSSHGRYPVDVQGRVIKTVPGATSCNVQVDLATVSTGSFNANDLEIVAKGDGSALAPIEAATEPEPAAAE